jgi:valyl-tRNA synthetase
MNVNLVIADEVVDREFGTGALKITPAHDPNDYETGKRHNLPLINIMNRDASINAAGGPRYQGLDRFACRTKIWEDIKAANLAIKAEPHMQRIPRSQRGGDIIEPLVSAQWFVRMKGMANRALEVVRTGEMVILPSRFEKTWSGWLENIRDWCVSRQLWWGHRIPVYYVDGSSTEYVVAKSIEEAQILAQTRYGRSVTLIQDEDVLDTWFR